jgi:predicted dehydrogenase
MWSMLRQGGDVKRRAFLGAALVGGVTGGALARRTYRVAVIGHTGRGGYGHGMDVVWKAFSQANVVACADPDAPGLAAVLKRTGAARGYAGYREMLRVEKPDIVSIGPRWLDQHRDMVTAAAEVGAHIYMEKPFAWDLADADRMVEVVRRHRVKLQIAHQMRRSPYALRAKAMIEAGDIGAVQEIRVRGKEDRRAGGEDMMVLGSHLCDMLRFFLGDPRWVSAHVTVDGREIAGKDAKEASEPIGPVAGNQVAAMFAFSNGVHGYFASRAAAETDLLRFGTWVYGSKGVLFLPNANYTDGALWVLRSAAWLPDDRARWERVEAAPIAEDGAVVARAGVQSGNAMMVADLLRAIESDGRPCCNEDDGRWTIEMVLGVYQAQRTGGRVPFPLANRRHPLGGDR